MHMTKGELPLGMITQKETTYMEGLPKEQR